ncbi:MAG: LPP20 family lipoprotein [Bacteroidia bacterium]|nr:LPP20 family lipoprotein [Bacteroidia bacterium]
MKPTAAFAFCGLLACLLLLSVPMAAQKGRKTKPEWISQRPRVEGYYIGISAASVSQNPGNYQEAARLSALNDMSGEIVVNIQGETDFTQRETNDEINEVFQNTIKSITENNLEGYEFVESYTEGDLFWAYYRISKQTYLANKRKRFGEAMANSESLFSKAETERQGRRIYPAFLLYSQALEPLIPYLISALEPEFKGKASEQNTKITTQLIKLLTGLRFTPAPAEIEYKLGSKKDLPVVIKVTYTEEGLPEVPVERLPVQFAFGPGAGTFQSATVNSNPQGLATAVVSKLEPTKRGVVVQATFKTDDFPILFDKRIALFTIGNVAPPSARVRIKTQGPSVKIESQESSLGKPLTQNILEPVVKDYLIENGCVVNDPSGNYDFIIEMKVETREGTTAYNAYQALLNATIVAINATTEDEVVSLPIQNLKGSKFDYENASRDAYAKARKKLEEEFLPQFLAKLYN